MIGFQATIENVWCVFLRHSMQSYRGILVSKDNLVDDAEHIYGGCISWHGVCLTVD